MSAMCWERMWKSMLFTTYIDDKDRIIKLNVFWGEKSFIWDK